MFRHERKSPLLRVFRAWWGHFKYLIVAVIVVCMMLYSIVHAATEKCKHGLTRELFEAEGQAGVRCLSQLRVKNVSFISLLSAAGCGRPPRAKGSCLRARLRSSDGAWTPRFRV